MADARLAKLALMLHYSVPAIICTAIVYVLIVDKTLGFFKLLGNRLPTFILTGMRTTFETVNIAVVLSSAFFVATRCEIFDNWVIFAPSTLRLEETKTCLPVLTLASILSLLSLWVDRITLALFSLPNRGHFGFRGRVVRATTVCCLFMALSKNDPFSLILLVSHAVSRPSTISMKYARLGRTAKYVAFVLRTYCFVCGVASLAGERNYQRVSSRSSAAVVMSTLSSQFS